MKSRNQILLERKIRKMVREELGSPSDKSSILQDLLQAQELIEKHENVIYVTRTFGPQAEREFDNATRYLGGLIGEIQRWH